MRLRALERQDLSFYNWKDQLTRHVYDRSDAAFARGDADRDALADSQAVDRRKSAIRAAFLDGIGGLPESDHPLSPVVTASIDERNLRIENVVFQSRPNTYVTASVYLPSSVSNPAAAVLFLCGHHEGAKHEAEYQAVCRRIAAAGLIVMAQDPIGQGERFSYYDPAIGGTTVGSGTSEHDYAGRPALLFGTGLARYFVHDAIRGLDYLASRPEVDAERIGVTGSSGGGTQTSLLLLADDRVAAAAPGTFIMNRRSFMYSGQAQDAEQIWPGFTAGGFDHEDILLMAAPKPVLVLAVSWDFFPIEGTRRTVARCKRIWRLYGAEEQLDLAVDASEHRFTPVLASAAASFFAAHLGSQGAVDISTEPTAPERLWCTDTGQVRAQFPDAIGVFEETTAVAKAAARVRTETPADERRRWLHDRVFSHRNSCDLNYRRLASDVCGELRVDRYTWWAQTGIFNFGALLAQRGDFDPPDRVALALWDGGTRAMHAHRREILQLIRGGVAVFVLDVTGTGAILPNPINTMPMHESYGTLFKLADDLIWLDDSLAAMRVYDVTRCVDLLSVLGVGGTGVELFAEGRQGVFGILASWLDDRIVAIRTGPGWNAYSDVVEHRHYDDRDVMGVVIPGILRYVELEEIVSEVRLRTGPT